MRIVLSDFISLDGVIQAPGGKEEDTDGGFKHGGWSMQFFDPEAMGPGLDESMKSTDALLFGRRTWQVMAGAWPGPGRRSLRRPHERDQEVRRLPHAHRHRPHVDEHHAAAGRRRHRRDREARATSRARTCR